MVDGPVEVAVEGVSMNEIYMRELGERLPLYRISFFERQNEGIKITKNKLKEFREITSNSKICERSLREFNESTWFGVFRLQYTDYLSKTLRVDQKLHTLSKCNLLY